MKLFLFLSLCCILGSFVDAHNLCGNWQPFKDEKCFKVLDNLVNFTTAKQMCSSLGEATILTIDSPEEQAFLSHFLFTTSKVVDNVWLGVRAQGGQLQWQDGSSLAVFNNWMTGGGPQNGSRLGACVQMNSEDGLTGTWTAVSCSKKNLVVCQREPLFSLETLKGLVFKMKAEQKQHQEKYEQHLKKYQEAMKEQAALFQLKNTQLECKSQEQVSKMKKENEQHRKHYEEAMNEQAIKITKLEATSSLPLGFIYIQLPKESAPSELWPSMTWTELSSTYAGVFFRVEGGGAGQFGEVQQDNAPKLNQVERQSCQYSPINNCDSIKDVRTLSLPSNSTWSDYVETADRYVYSIEGIDSSKLTRYIDYLRFRHSTGEVRPRNMAVKVWKRTG